VRKACKQKRHRPGIAPALDLRADSALCGLLFGFGRERTMTEVMTAAPNGVAAAEQPWLEVLGSRHFAGWLVEQNVSLALTTYQAGGRGAGINQSAT
jgi:hypothetical protein